MQKQPNKMTKEKLIKLLEIAYKWGRDNGEGRSEKNFNDLLATKTVNEATNSILEVAGQSKQSDYISFAKYLNENFYYFDNTDVGDVYKDNDGEDMYSENDIYDEWLNNR